MSFPFLFTPPPPHPLNPTAFAEGGGQGWGVCASMPPLNIGPCLLGYSLARAFKPQEEALVAPFKVLWPGVSGRGLQEMACGARPEVRSGSGPGKLEGRLGLGAKAASRAGPQVFGVSGVSAAGAAFPVNGPENDFLAAGSPAPCHWVDVHPESLGPWEVFSVGNLKGR